MAIGTIIMGLGYVFMMFASKEASAEKSPVIKPLTAAKIKITAIIMSITFILDNFGKSTLYFYKLKIRIVSLRFK